MFVILINENVVFGRDFKTIEEARAYVDAMFYLYPSEWQHDSRGNFVTLYKLTVRIVHRDRLLDPIPREE